MIYDDSSMRHAKRETRKIKTEGGRRKWLDDYFGFDDSSRDGVKCLRCRDSGYAMIYHPEVVIAAAQNEDSPKWHKTLAIRCNCEAGDKKPSQSREQAARSKKNMDDKSHVHEKEPVFGDHAWHIAVNDPDGKAKCMEFELQAPHTWQPWK